MNTEFCINCGNRFEYTLNRPKFCSACGTSLNEKDSIQPKERSEAAIVETEDDAVELPNISKLEYTISNNQNNLTFGDLVSQASNDPSAGYQKMDSRPMPAPASSDDIIKQTLKQCRSAREPSDIGGE